MKSISKQNSNYHNHQVDQFFIESLKLFGFLLMSTSELDFTIDFKDKMKSTNTTDFYRAIGRDVKPNWGNRIIKDFNDLDYNVDQKKHSFRNQESIKKRKLLSDLKRRTKKKGQSRTPDSKSLKKQYKYVGEVQYNPETIDIGVLESSSPKIMGLSTFQYKNTIEGRLQNRSNHHLSFDLNKVARSVNLNPIYYEKDEDVNLSYYHHKKTRSEIKKLHSFQSYTVRRVFEPKEQLDKIYDTDSDRKRCSPQKIKKAVLKFENAIRLEDKPQPSSKLSYEIAPCLEAISKDKCQYSIPYNARKIKFYPQVISSRRGCYR